MPNYHLICSALQIPVRKSKFKSSRFYLKICLLIAMSLCFAFSGCLATYSRDKKSCVCKNDELSENNFYFAGVLRAIYAVLGYYSSHSFGTCSSFIWMEEKNFDLREGAENKADAVEAVGCSP